ncbi:MAG: cytochrome C [Chthoniobacterales bacterium]|nr:cytochrome C [Chthoniobacterales bacterium]
MPIYEFYSPDTNKVYSFFARSLAQGKGIPRCPDKPGARMERMLSRFAVTGRAVEKPDSPGPEDPRMERVMAEMQSEMAGMDEGNPDPKAIGRMMRKMTEATGQPMPKVMEQMIRRMEAGEDPEKLEEEFGDAMEGLDFPDADSPAESGGTRQTQRRPVRDPVLYEMGDFL